MDMSELMAEKSFPHDILEWTHPPVHVCVNGGYVEGQRYLQRNVETERPEYIRLLKENIERLV